MGRVGNHESKNINFFGMELKRLGASFCDAGIVMVQRYHG